MTRKNQQSETIALKKNSPGIFEFEKITGNGKILFATLCILIMLFFSAKAYSQPSADAEGYDSTNRTLLFLGNDTLPPMIYMKNEKQVGIVVDLAEALKERMTRPVRFKYMNWTKAQQLVLEGKADALLQINFTEERKKIYDFSNTLLESEFSIFTSFDRVGVYDLTGLRGLKVGVEEKGLPINILKHDPLIKSVVVPDIIRGFHLLADGAVDAVVVDRWVGTFVLAENNIKGIIIVGEAINKSDSTIAVKKGNTELLTEINKALAEIKEDGTYTEILAKWQPKEVIFQTRDQYFKQKVILAAVLCMLIITIIWGIFLLNSIKKRKKTEQTLRESEERYRNFVTNASEGIYRIDFTTPIHVDVSDEELVATISKHAIVGEVNEALSRMYGLRPEDMVNRLATDFAPEYGERALLVVRAPQHQVMDIETRDLDKNGQSLYLSESYSAVVENGFLVRIWGMQRDITDRKQMETKIIQERDFSNSVLNSLPDAFYMFDTAGKMRQWNQNLEIKTGYSSEEIAQMVALDFISKNYKETTLKAIQETFAVGESTVESQFLTKSGDIIPYFLSGKRVNIDGITYLSGMGVNITKQKQAEEEKRKALEFAAEQRKLALIGQVAGKMAHDFNNVLMGIMGNSQLAIMNCDDEKTKVKLERINEFSERGRDITNNLMSFSKDQEPKQTYFKIENKIDLVLKMLEKNMTGIGINRNYRPGIPELLGDPGMIQDVLTNVIQNSIHAMSKVENPILNLKLYSQDDKVYLEIEDNGCGIPKEHQDSIYTPSFTLKGSQDKTGSYKSGIKGSGYGMSNVKKYVVEKHKGEISLKSEVGKGTKIAIVLRVIKNQLSSDEKKEVSRTQIYDKRRILLVEDEPAIADVQYEILTEEPFSHIVSMAVNGQAAIDSFDRNKFDAVSLDYMLPGNINGLDVYKHIREKDKDIPVMFISGNMEFLESMKKLKEKDHNLEYLSKPIDNLDYVNKVNELIGKSIK